MANYYSAKYGERQLKVVDALNRRAGHVALFSARCLWYFALLRNVPTMFRCAIVCELIPCLLKIYYEKMPLDDKTSGNILGRIFFAGMRVRDGNLARLNGITISAFGYLGMVWTCMLPFLFGLDDLTGRFFFVLSMQGLIWGDAMAELVGSFFGRLQFPVYGMGEINYKTVEGVVACWLANFFAMWLCTVSLSSMDKIDQHVLHIHPSPSSEFLPPAGGNVIS